MCTTLCVDEEFKLTFSTSFLSFRLAQTTATTKTRRMTISQTYRVGFDRKSRLAKTNDQSMVFGWTTKPPLNRVVWLQWHFNPLLVAERTCIVIEYHVEKNPLIFTRHQWQMSTKKVKWLFRIEMADFVTAFYGHKCLYCTIIFYFLVRNCDRFAQCNLNLTGILTGRVTIQLDATSNVKATLTLQPRVDHSFLPCVGSHDVQNARLVSNMYPTLKRFPGFGHFSRSSYNCLDSSVMSASAITTFPYAFTMFIVGTRKAVLSGSSEGK